MKTAFLIVAMLYSSSIFAWEIDSNGVDDLILGRPLPVSLAHTEKEKVDMLIADGVPFKGFRFNEPPLLVSLRRKKISMMIIESPNIRTKKKIGVGSTLKQINTAYKNVSINPVPSTLGGDEAVAIINNLPNVYFYFKDLKAAKTGGKVVRVMIFRQ